MTGWANRDGLAWVCDDWMNMGEDCGGPAVESNDPGIELRFAVAKCGAAAALVGARPV